MAESAASCAHCGKAGVDLKRCSVCKDASYCGAACQKAGWRRHKKTCESPLPPQEVYAKVKAADSRDDWRGVLKWEGRMEELLERQDDGMKESILSKFAHAYKRGKNSSGSNDHVHSVIRVELRRIELLGEMERFRDQGEVICSVAESLLFVDNLKDAKTWYLRARKLGEQHGFISVESDACLGLGQLAMTEGRHAEGLELIRNAFAAALLSEEWDNHQELNALRHLTSALFITYTIDGGVELIDEVEPLVPRFGEMAKDESRYFGKLCLDELNNFYNSARLHEARGRPHEAAAEVRALLARMRENPATVQDSLPTCEVLLARVAGFLHLILSPEAGGEDLIKAVEDEQEKLRRGYT